MQQSIDIMNVPVLPASVMYTILVHGNFRAIENRWLIHIVPYVEI
jgi:hypothetical protein